MTNKNLKPKIKQLDKEGFSYKEIANKLNCSRANVYFHLRKGFKEKCYQNTVKYRKTNHPFVSKIESFLTRTYIPSKINSTNKKYISSKIHDFSRIIEGKKRMRGKKLFTTQDVLNKFSDNPRCALTGKEINILEPSTYHFDHKQPVSRGGDNSLDNLQLLSKEVNFAKRDMLNEEFIELCKQVLQHQGFKIIKDN